MAACEEATGPSAGRFGPDSQRSGNVARGASGVGGALQAGPDARRTGTGQFINSDALTDPRGSRAVVLPVGDDLVELSLVNASVSAAAEEVLGKTLGLAYVLSNDLDFSVTIQTTRPVSKTALYDLFEAALEANGASIENQNNVLRIVRGRSGNRTFRLSSDGVGQGNAIIVAPLEYVSPEEMIGLMAPLIEDGLRVQPDTNRSLLLLSGPQATVEAALDALNLFDVDVMEGKSVALVPLRAARPDDVVQELNRIFEAEEGGALEGVVEFVPNQRLGSVLIISSRARYVDRARRWIRDLDRQAAGSARFLQTYDLHHRNADEVAPILNGLLSGAADDAAGGDDLALAADGGGDGFDAGPATEAAAARVAADTSRNSLIVRATREEHHEIAAMLRDLDTAARQVMIEATIAEVTLNDELEVGVRWFFENGDFGYGFSDLANGGTGPSFPGFSAVLNGPGVDVALNALSSVTDVEVISAPTLLVVDNQEGLLQIGDEVPIAVQTATESDLDAIVLTQIEYRDTGIILKVRPRIGANGEVSLKIEQEVSDVSATVSSGIDSPTISTRRVETHAVLSDGQTLTLGGLVQESDNVTRTQVPGLGQVPGIGALFRRKDSAKERTELIIMLRPRVLHNPQHARQVTQEWRNKLNSASSVLSTGLGPARHSINDVAY